MGKEKGKKETQGEVIGGILGLLGFGAAAGGSIALYKEVEKRKAQKIASGDKKKK